MDFSSSESSGDEEEWQQEEEQVLTAEQRRLLELQELKDKLLLQRDELQNDVGKLQRQLEKPVKLDQNASDLLLDLLLVPKAPTASNADIPKSATQFIDGISPIQQELLSKFDTLPLLNMDLRLKKLKELYPDMQLEVISDKTSAAGVSETEISAKFTDTGLQVLLELQYDTNLATLIDFTATVNDQYKTELSPLISKCRNNPTMLLFCCNEYNRLNKRAYTILKTLKEAFSSQLNPHFESRTCLSCINTVTQRDKSASVIQLNIIFDIQAAKNSSLPLPTTKIIIKLSKDGTTMLQGPNNVLNGLMSEYGVTEGLLSFSKVCLYPYDYQSST